MDNTTPNVGATDAPIQKKNPLLAAIGSFFFPGLGQVYNGDGMVNGLLYLIGTIVGSLLLIIPGLLIWIYGIYNAYSRANKVSEGALPYKDVSAGTLILYVILSIIVWLVVTVIFALFIAAFVFAMVGPVYQ